MQRVDLIRRLQCLVREASDFDSPGFDLAIAKLIHEIEASSMPVRVLRLLEYRFEDAEAAQKHLSQRWVKEKRGSEGMRVTEAIVLGHEFLEQDEEGTPR